jgi:hypothetical protein
MLEISKWILKFLARFFFLSFFFSNHILKCDGWGKGHSQFLEAGLKMLK